MKTPAKKTTNKITKKANARKKGCGVVRISDELSDRLLKLSKKISTKQTVIANAAIQEYLDRNEGNLIGGSAP